MAFFSETLRIVLTAGAHLKKRVVYHMDAILILG